MSKVRNPIYCTACGRKVGQRTGDIPVPGVLCTDPVCEYQGASDHYPQRDSYILAMYMDGVSATVIARGFEISRQRVYQIIDKWKSEDALKGSQL